MRTTVSRARTVKWALGVALGTMSALGVSTTASALLISVDFGSGYAGAVQPLFSGVESSAAALDPAFGSANVWNDLTTGDAGVISDPSYSSLLDSTGAITDVGFSITGTLDSYNGVSSTASSLTRDYLFWNASPSQSATLSWTISGLTPAASYALVFYGANTDVDRSMDMTIDGYGAVGAVVTSNGSQPDPLYVQTVVASAAGVISGTAAANPGFEGDWAGFQIVSAMVPEPSTALLLASGLAVFAAGRRRWQRAP
jgi:PEP-CTERM motif